MPQGLVLGPVLFLAYINDIVDKLDHEVTVQFFADDRLLYATIRFRQDQDKLNTALSGIASWCNRWKM